MASTPLSKKSKLVYLKARDNDQVSEHFEYPHFYTPTALAQEAAKDLQERLKKDLPELINQPKGRMLGVLVVKGQDEKLGYLSAYSGELQPSLEMLSFVPSVYQLPKGKDFPEMASINAISREIKSLEQDETFALLKEQLQQTTQEVEENIQAAKIVAKKGKAERDKLRKASLSLPEQERQELLEQLSRQGAHAGMDLRRFTRSEKQRLEKAREATGPFEEQIRQLKVLRKAKSAELQEAIFKAFVFLNNSGESKDVKTVFNDFGIDVPPAGAGECAAPKLFQYAFQHDLKPVALAEFWWGASPISEIREHGKFYPACRGKCEPILSHMLKGISVKPNPLLENAGADKHLETLYEDSHIVIVNKPEGMLSVPGRHINDSVQARMQKRYPEATGPLTVHRLDQDTSGIMVIALSKAAHKLLQQQFLKRTIHKTYIAILERPIDETAGVIELPLILDYYNRPMQMVDYEQGKPAVTHYEVLEKTPNRTLIKLNPVTGRSHQLRVHCAHKLGLHAPIVGDNLYGNRGKRLCLHAQQIVFAHPITKEEMKIESPLPFTI